MYGKLRKKSKSKTQKKKNKPEKEDKIKLEKEQKENIILSKEQSQTTEIIRDKSYDISYNCTECSSLIEIISINQENNSIKFKCLNKNNSHEKTLSIKDYLIKMKKYYNKQLNDDICKVHINNNEKYISYCINCKNHLCKECLKSGKHLNHNKNAIMEIQPTQEELNIIKELINYYNTKVENLKNESMIINEKLEKSLNDKEIKLKNIFKEKTQINENNRIKDLKINKEKFISEIEEIKKKYEEEIKIKINEYENYNNKINNEYREINEKNNIIYKSKKNEINKKYNEKIEILGYNKKIENLNNLKKFNEIVYNTYIIYKQNYFNCLNIKSLVKNYYKSEDIKNNIIKNILKDNNNKVSELIFERNYQNGDIIEKEVQEEKDKTKNKSTNNPIENINNNINNNMNYMNYMNNINNYMIFPNNNMMMPNPMLGFNLMDINYNDEEWLKAFEFGNEGQTTLQKIDGKINIIFRTTQGITHTLSFKYGTTIDEVLKKYLDGINEKECIYNQDEAYRNFCFIYSGRRLELGDKTKIEHLFLGWSNPRIIVNDVRNVIPC